MNRNTMFIFGGYCPFKWYCPSAVSLTTLFFFLPQQSLNSSGKGSSSVDGPKFPGDKTSSAQNNNQQKKGIQVLPDGEAF